MGEVVTARFCKLDVTAKVAWRFFVGDLMVGGWVLSYAQHERVLEWADQIKLPVSEESRPS